MTSPRFATTRPKNKQQLLTLGRLHGQLEQIETRSATLAKQVLDEAVARRNEIEQIQKSISLDEFHIWRDGNIYSQYSGRVAEMMAAVGDVLPAGGCC